LVDVVMKEIPEPADETGRGGDSVVGAEEASKAGVGVEPGHRSGEGVGVDGDVGVEEEDQGGLGGKCAGVPGGGRAELGRVPDHAGAGLLGQLGGGVGRTVVDHHQFVVVPGRFSKPAEAALEVATPVVHGDHHRERRPPGLRARRTGGELIHEPPSPVKLRVPECVPILGVARTRASISERGRTDV
jgi:hypothetical protein